MTEDYQSNPGCRLYQDGKPCQRSIKLHFKCLNESKDKFEYLGCGIFQGQYETEKIQKRLAKIK